MPDRFPDIVNGSIVSKLVASGVLASIATGFALGFIWVGKLDQRIYALEQLATQNFQLAQTVAAADAAQTRLTATLEERMDETLKHIDAIELHISAQDDQIVKLEIETAVENQGSTVRRPRP